MKKIEVRPKNGHTVRIPLFVTSEALFLYMTSQATVEQLASEMIVVSLDGENFRRSIIEWMGVKYIGKSSFYPWIRYVRGVVETGSRIAPKWEPFSGWCHPGMLMFENWDEEKMFGRRCDDDKTVDMDPIFAHHFAMM